MKHHDDSTVHSIDCGGPADDPLVKVWGERFPGIFLIGGTLGGWIFSSMADKRGRKPVMALTILCYSVFSGLTAFASEIWHVERHKICADQ